MMLTGLAGFMARSALMQSPVGGFLKAVPAWAWKALAIIALLFAGYLYHQHKARAAIAAAEKRGAETEAARIVARIKKLTDRVNGLAGRIREKQREETGRIVRSYDTLRLSGPGRARCTAGAFQASTSGRSQPRPGSADGTADPVPAEDRAAVPWAWLLDSGQQCDLNLDEVKRWREWWRSLPGAAEPQQK